MKFQFILKIILIKKKKYFIKDPVTKYIHPFFGFTEFDGKIDKNNKLTNEALFANIYVHQPNQSRDFFNILILGSTLSKSFSEGNLKNNYKNNILEESFKKNFKEKNFRIYNASIRNSKQPQQLFKLYYLDLLGFKFDLIINIDGITEITHLIVKNYVINDELIYPRRFSEEIWETNKDYSCMKKSNSFSNRVSIIPIIEIYDLTYIYLCGKKVKELPNHRKLYWKTKIKKNSMTEEEIISKSIKIWRDSSIKILNYSSRNNSNYLHVVLPNIHDRESKSLTKDELILKNKGYEYQYILEKYYKNLNLHQIPHFLDLKNTFLKNNFTVYSDTCCHFNEYGLKYLSDTITDYVKTNLLIK